MGVPTGHLALCDNYLANIGIILTVKLSGPWCILPFPGGNRYLSTSDVGEGMKNKQTVVSSAAYSHLFTPSFTYVFNTYI